MLNLSPNKIKSNIAEEHLSALKVLQTPKAGKLLARWIIGIFLLMVGAMFLPWQQNIRGDGEITAINPADRPQTVETAIAGRIEEWFIQEGQRVARGDTLLRLSEVKEKYFDPDLLERLREQLEAKESTIANKEEKADALRDQLQAMEEGLQLKLAQARNKLQQIILKVKSDSADLVSEQVQNKIAEEQLERQQALFEKGLKSRAELESRSLKFQESRAKVVAQENKYLAAQNELMNARIELNSIETEVREKMSKARSELSATLSEVNTSEGELAKLRNEYANMRIRSENYYLTAPQSGFIVQAQKAGIGETLKEGEAVVTIMPANPGIAAALYIKPMDVPLLSKGRKVRLEFEGWPALQFSGWPSVSVGTFGGVVRVIDYVESPVQPNMYRILVVPDPDDEPWPPQLRMGSGVHGWVMLDEVPVWYEIWRQLNGFPASLKEAPDTYYEEKELKK
ncbi:HlyD family secretion protein [Nafulsella turpanensis]|uniref:HlyD family secretion protein n=1 Tax=Nafulsella turpanensis TaxID=1265690 RepID=UPI000344AC9E|nr:biotin/lipoyl-binding protein [Nafulsella turpanensis]